MGSRLELWQVELRVTEAKLEAEPKVAPSRRTWGKTGGHEEEECWEKLA